MTYWRSASIGSYTSFTARPDFYLFYPQFAYLVLTPEGRPQD